MVWVWCLHCQRAFPEDLYRSLPSGLFCAYEDCPAQAPYDMLPWAAVRALSPSLPEVPYWGHVYAIGAPALVPGLGQQLR